MKRLVVVAFVFWFPGLHAQQVIASMGHYAESQQGSLSYTLGEAFITTLHSGDHCLTQGFHQGSLILTNIFERHRHLPNVKVYPNPVQKTLLLEATGENTGLWQYELVSMEGQRILKAKFSGAYTEITIHSCSAGIYLLRIFSAEELVKIVKIVKK